MTDECSDPEVVAELVARCSTICEARFITAMACWGALVRDEDRAVGILVGEAGVMVDISPQHSMEHRDGFIRIDFMFCGIGADGSKRVAVEIDDASHWREAVKAATDRIRDRALARKGITVLRFTNDEIMRDARACAEETYNILAVFIEDEDRASQESFSSGWKCGQRAVTKEIENRAIQNSGLPWINIAPRGEA